MDERLTEVETKLAWVERALGELDGVVRGLSEQMELLRREVGRLRDRDQRGEPPPASEKPPHW